jgi:hypothetical protein
MELKEQGLAHKPGTNNREPFLKKLKIRLLYDPAAPLLGINM